MKTDVQAAVFEAFDLPVFELTAMGSDQRISRGKRL
jgi:hypothetical protein